jgi:HTH-like domain/Integrase core domain
MSAPDRKMLLDPAHPRLSIRRQCSLLGLARSGFYRPARVANDDELAIRRRLDELFLLWPFFGSRRMTARLHAEGWRINRKRVQRLMRQMGLVALGPKPKTSKPASGHKIYPYLLRDLLITRPNQVWCADVTYIAMARGFLYLVAIMDWASRAVLSWQLSNTLDADFCARALDEALARPGQPVHEYGLHRQAVGCRNQHLDGRSRPLARQCVHRAAVALAQIRGDLSQGLRRWPRGARRDRRLVRLLRWNPAPPSAGRQDAG